MATTNKTKSVKSIKSKTVNAKSVKAVCDVEVIPENIIESVNIMENVCVTEQPVVVEQPVVEADVNVNKVDVPSINQADCIAISLTYRVLGAIKNGDKQEIETSADKSAIALKKTIFDSEKYNAILKHDNNVRLMVNNWTNQFLDRRSVRVFHKNALVKIDNYLKSMAAIRKELVEDFLQIYPVLKEDAMLRLGKQFNANDYKDIDTVRNKFSFSWQYLSLGLPENIPAEIKEEQIAKAESIWNSAAIEIRDTLRLSFVELFKHLDKALKGEVKRFYSSNITNLIEFIDCFNQRDLTKDNELKDILAKCKNIVAEINPESVRNDEDYRKKMAESLAEMNKTVETLAVSVNKRRFSTEAWV